ncbi:putative phospholipase ABHD3 [Monocercomonoides exilis]|uniref:putative phospholipase ABHD3 n=1 Tax=Monocercomonoides exilis TaxID=2049356 RepID=UPI003559A113|nr:putative phospholipase ABHD3 [Monocercomonoides exilis]|eukprot:MONOS_16567.1-p1 / transcript=MONOS_16567.1 / gene=MONOS_16567 / organism=Monocercomonoides_exilis_PA203 / gene_product=alpha / transcript_product=alpha / location=Mono_scaffold01869:179-1375(+) / protein_length=398 / sequence_SO=supercontig / SO=protein_coding / is_pseudo=false
MEILIILRNLFATVFIVWFILWMRNAGHVKVIGKGRYPFHFLNGKESKFFYFPHWKYGISQKLNTAGAYLENKSKKRPLREFLEGLDGGKFSLDWFVDENATKLHDSSPIVVFVHGINGGSSEPPLQKFALRCVKEIGWRSVCVIFRGCCGTKINTYRSYHGGYTEDFHIALKTIQERYPLAPIAVVGYSLGGNMVAKYFGERESKTRPKKLYGHLTNNEAIPSNVVCAAAVCCPFNFIATDKYISKKDLIQVGKGMIKYIDNQGPFLQDTDMYRNFFAQNDRSSFTIDNYFTKNFFGYETVYQMYDEMSCWHYLDGIRHPFLFISTKNDPVSIYKAFPTKVLKSAGDYVGALVLPGGAHLGMFEMFSTKKTFDEELLLKYFSYYFNSTKTRQESKQE